jgi:hypothetical protein
MIDFETSTVIYTAKDSGNAVFRNEKTLGFLFMNTGNCPVKVNNMTLPPSGFFKSFEIGGRDLTNYRILFDQFSSCATNNAELTVLIYSTK